MDEAYAVLGEDFERMFERHPGKAIVLLDDEDGHVVGALVTCEVGAEHGSNPDGEALVFVVDGETRFAFVSRERYLAIKESSG